MRGKIVGNKSSGNRAKKRFLYLHEYRDQKMGGKNARNNYSRNKRIVRARIVEKKIFGKVRKNTGEIIFLEHTNSANQKCLVKNSLEKCEKTIYNIYMNIITENQGICEKNRFLYSHEYRDLKIRGKNARNDFFRYTRIVCAKNVREKNVGSCTKKSFFIFT